MRELLTAFAVATLLTHLAMAPTVRISEQIIGKWKMEQVHEGDVDISNELNPDGDRWIAFKPDGTFASGGGPYGDNTGKYIIDDEAETLFLDSDAGEDDDSKWKVAFDGDKMVMSGIGTERQQRTKVISVRVKG